METVPPVAVTATTNGSSVGLAPRDPARSSPVPGGGAATRGGGVGSRVPTVVGKLLEMNKRRQLNNQLAAAGQQISGELKVKRWDVERSSIWWE